MRKKLSADRLQQCYKIISPQIQQYLPTEVNIVLKHIYIGDAALERGYGYGRILKFFSSPTTRSGLRHNPLAADRAQSIIKNREEKIVCNDDFSAGPLSPKEFADFAFSLKILYKIEEIGNSNLFCILTNDGD